MVNNLTVAPTTGNNADAAAAAPQRAAPTPDPASTSATANKATPTANPSHVLDLGLNLVVLQFHDGHGDLTQSIPSERQLRAYRDGTGATADAASKV